MKSSYSFAEFVARLFCLLFGLFVLAQGIALTILANLGTDAITSPALVAHLLLGTQPGGAGYEWCTVGNMLICVHVTLVLMQIVLLRRKYRPIQLLQMVNALLLGAMLDACLGYTVLLPVPNYAAALGYTLAGCCVSAFGIFTFVKANLVPLSAEGLCLALSRVFNWRFSRVKVGVDCSMLGIAVAVSLLLLGTLAGVREGSLICAVSTGFIIGLFFRHCSIWDKFFAMAGKREVPSGINDTLA